MSVSISAVLVRLGALPGFLLGLLVAAMTLPGRGAARRFRDERGLSQSTENAILLAGAVTVAGIVILAVTKFVTGHMPK